MTYKEKLAADHPDWSEEAVENNIIGFCPWEYGYDYPPAGGCSAPCENCWDHEVVDEAAVEVVSASPDKITALWHDIWKWIISGFRRW